MKVLILTVTAGEGHNSTATAIETVLQDRGIDCSVLDTCLKINRGLYDIISKGYLLSTAEFKKTYAFLYSRFENRKRNSYTPSFTRTAYNMIKKKVQEHIALYAPDVIVYTHVFAGVLLDVMREKGKIDAGIRTVGIVTDFVMHPFWEDVLRTDRVVIPNEMLVPAARRKGFSDAQIVPSGIPIRPQFAEAIGKAEARAELGLDPEKPTILLMGGSMGYGSLAKTMQEIDALPTDFQVISVCGRNQKAKEEIDAISFRKTVRNFGYTEQISLLMDAADCIVTKPGGLTTSEALAKNLPLIISNPIPGHEERNTEFLVNNGAAMVVSKTYDLADAIYQLFYDETRLDSMRRNIALLRKPNATHALCDLVEQLGKEDKR
jgi:processive 1,2-diacylglycerol beta-glucosyltransferase